MKKEKKLYIIPEWEKRREYMELAENLEAAFEYNDFYQPLILDSPALLDEKIQGYQKLDRDRTQDTMHGAFFDLVINSSDPKIREISRLRVRQCMEIADRLGLKAVIFHTNMIPGFMLSSYVDGWIRDNKAFWMEILSEYPDRMIYLENMFDFNSDMLKCLAVGMKEEHRFGICLDYAHSAISGEKPEQWFQTLAPYILHMHINDNDLQSDLHLPVGKGKIDWNTYHQQILQNKVSPTVLIEVRGAEAIQNSVQYMRENEIYPFSPK